MTVTDNQFNDLSNTVSSIDDRVTVLETEIGTNPQGPYATVRARLDILESRISSSSGGGGGSGNAISLQGRPITPAAPTDGQVLTWINADGEWEPATPTGGGFTAGGDLSGTSTNQNVTKIHGATIPIAGSLTTGNILQVTGSSALSYVSLGGDLSGAPNSALVTGLNGHPVSSSTPSANNVLTWSGTNWAPAAPSSAPTGAAGGDLSGTYPNPGVAKINGVAVTGMGPSTGYVLTATSGINATWQAPTGGGTASVSAADGRLTLTTGVPFTTTDVTGASTIYYTPFVGNSISLFDGVSTWTQLSFTELSLALSGLISGKNYDVFVYNNAGTATLELSAAWTTDTSRADALTRQNGVLVKSAATTRRFVGTIRTTGTTTTEDSASKRFVWNIKNAKTRLLHVAESTNSWNYTTTTFRAVNGNAANCFEFIQGDDMLISVTAIGIASNSTAGSNTVSIGIGMDSTTVSSANMMGGNALATSAEQMSAFYKGYPTIGYHKVTWLEAGNVNVTFYGTAGSASIIQTGMIGEIIS